VHKPRVSYIVSCYNRPDLLPIVLYSLKVQTDDEFEVIVTDNAPDKKTQNEHRKVVASLKDKRFRHVVTAGKTKVSDCYWSAEYGAKSAKGDWLCFPCDDCYYVPEFQERMLEIAALYAWKLVLCDAVYRYNTKRYAVLNMRPNLGVAAKSSFIVARDKFPGFSLKPSTSAPCAADAAMINSLVGDGVPYGTVQDVMVVHN
jgi:glycosyltransferase involved in cell wall biosynthesis